METLGLRVIEPNGLSANRTQNAVPAEFGFEAEHPVVSLPYSLYVLGQKFEGKELSITSIHAEAVSYTHLTLLTIYSV